MGRKRTSGSTGQRGFLAFLSLLRETGKVRQESQMEDQDVRELARSVAELQELQLQYPDCVTTRQLLALVEEVQVLVQTNGSGPWPEPIATQVQALAERFLLLAEEWRREQHGQVSTIQ